MPSSAVQQLPPRGGRGNRDGFWWENADSDHCCELGRDKNYSFVSASSNGSVPVFQYLQIKSLLVKICKGEVGRENSFKAITASNGKIPLSILYNIVHGRPMAETGK